MDFITYFKESQKQKDIDPANDCLVYLCGRFELTMEQRYWLAFLYSTCYCGATVYYMYNEFPDYYTVDVNRLEKWWKENKHKLIFQTDRLRIKTTNQFVPTFLSYKKFIGEGTQQERFYKLKTPSVVNNYRNAYKEVGTIRNVGRFTLFIYLEMLNLLTDFKCVPDTIDWKYADNCRKGMELAMGYEYNDLFDRDIKNLSKKLKSNIFAVETVLCAYYKYHKGQRYVGYYKERQLKEINKMAANVPDGVYWNALYQFRKEVYGHD
jgi:hypothetical protein